MLLIPARIIISAVERLGFVPITLFQIFSRITTPKPRRSNIEAAAEDIRARILRRPLAIPDDNLYVVTATFAVPGSHVLWARADDGGLYHDQYITVVVEP